MPVIPPEYVACIEKMVQAGRAWIDAQPPGDLRLDFRAFPKNATVTGDLDEYGIQQYGLNEPTREMLRAMDKATNHQATLLMAQTAVAILGEAPDVIDLGSFTPTKR